MRRCEPHKFFVDICVLKKPYKTRKRAESTHSIEAAHEIRQTYFSTPSHWWLVYKRVVHHCSTMRCKNSTRYTFHWSLHLWNIFGRTQGRAEALATSCNFNAQSIKENETKHTRRLVRKSKRRTQQCHRECILCLYRTPSCIKAEYSTLSTGHHNIIQTSYNRDSPFVDKQTTSTRITWYNKSFAG